MSFTACSVLELVGGGGLGTRVINNTGRTSGVQKLENHAAGLKPLLFHTGIHLNDTEVLRWIK